MEKISARCLAGNFVMFPLMVQACPHGHQAGHRKVAAVQRLQFLPADGGIHVVVHVVDEAVQPHPRAVVPPEAEHTEERMPEPLLIHLAVRGGQVLVGAQEPLEQRFASLAIAFVDHRFDGHDGIALGGRALGTLGGQQCPGPLGEPRRGGVGDQVLLESFHLGQEFFDVHGIHSRPAGPRGPAPDAPRVRGARFFCEQWVR
ncbi:hypothetical protein [Paeniglutamicibacter psychrophenolicus]|uniref:Secreted protein n=1 Tax=Paeniglutamicibacter psychrophenolicus TaxID=257454 RepID=A0ABS4WBM7_9MICC|nr:hypothetical protein [Paeniglutamicibacter psychrophenolicus]MBP2373570.1 hypothetical protein [Paeniglutamicibacter psychrophenolicus]